MSIVYNSWQDNFKKPFGAIELGEKLKISIKAAENITNVSLIISTDEEIVKEIQMIKNNNNTFTASDIYFGQENIYFYYFRVNEDVNGDIQVRYYGKNQENAESKEYYNEHDINKYQLTVSKCIKTPKWFKEGILYHIFVDRFNKTGKINNPKKDSFIYANWEDTPMYIKNDEGEVLRWDFHGGNLKGIISKLSYLKNLGISIIYLSPIFESQSNHKYDTGNYKAIDPMFGDENIFSELIKEAEKRGISIILDGVFSHTGDDSIYFNKYGNYDSIGAYQSEKSPYSSWYNFENYPDKYDCWWGIKSLPNVNDKDSVIKKWMSYGVKGWRLDVADELPSNFIEELREETLNVDEESILIGEVWEDASNKISYEERRKYFLGNQLNGVTGYLFKNIIVDFLNGKISSKEVYNKFMTIKENYPKEAFKSNLNLLGTHDTSRILTELNNDKSLLKLAVAAQMTFEGIPYIYYGDEAGVIGGKDPDNRRTYPWKNEDKDILNFYKKIVRERNNSEALVNGNSRFLDLENPNIFGYVRYIENNTINDDLIVINRSEKEEELNMYIEEIYRLVVCAEEKFEVKDNQINIKLDPKSFIIFILFYYN